MRDKPERKAVGDNCQRCGSQHLILIRSQELKICNICGADHYWPTDEGQDPLIQNNRRKDK